MCYREDVPPLEFDGMGIACLSGENGAGKSALLDALTWALWGEARLKSDDDLIALGADEMSVELIFTLDQQDYRVIRRRSKGRRGKSELDFQVRNNGAWKVIGAETIRETQHTITSTLRMAYDTFANSAFLRQGRADEFTRKEPARRKQVLADILGLDVYESLESSAKERAKELDGQLKVLDGRISELSREADQHAARLEMVASAERVLSERVAQLNTAQRALDEAVAAVQELERLIPLRDDADLRLKRLHTDRTERAREVAQLQAAIDAAQQTIARRDEIREQIGLLSEAQEQMAHLDGLRGDYDVLIDQQRTAANAIRDAEQHLRSDVRIAESELRGLRERASRLPTIDAEIASLSERLDRFASAEQELTRHRDRRADLQGQRNEAARLQLQRKELENQIALRQNSLIATREEKKRRIRDLTDRLQALDYALKDSSRTSAERDNLLATQDQLETLRRDERAMLERVSTLRAACDTIKQQGDELNRKLAVIQHDADTCPLCGNGLGHGGLARIEATYEQERVQLRQHYLASKREADTLEHELGELGTQADTLEQQVGRLPAVLGKLAQLDAQASQADDLREQLVAEQRTHDDVAMQVMKGDYEHAVRGELSRVEAALTALGNTDSVDRELARLDARMTKLDEQLAQRADLRAQRETLRREQAMIAQEADLLRQREQELAALRATIEMSDFAPTERAALHRAERALAKLGYSPDQHRAARDLVRTLAGWADEERRLERAEALIERDTQALANAEALLARLDDDIAALSAQRGELQTRLAALAPSQRRRDEAEALLRERQRTRAIAERDLGEKQSYLQRSERATEELLSCEAHRDAMTHRKGLFDELTGSFSKKGVQALLIEAAIPEIEREANVLLGRMTDNQMHLSLETQRGTKKGDVAETLDIKISDALGTRDYDAYSGGESFRVDFAIRIALAKLLAHRAGARLETLVIDEGFGSQDAKGRERLVEAITSVQPDFKQILVVTHIQELKDMFPVHIEISKTQQGSRWAIG